MLEKLKKIFFKITYPSLTSILLTGIVLVFVVTSTVFMLSIEYEGTILEPFAYCAFGLSAIGFAYIISVSVIGAPIIKKKVIVFFEGREFTRRLIRDWGYRTVLTSTVAFAMSIINSVFNAYLGISEKSIWFGALSAYYIFLALMRSGLLIYHRTRRDYENEAIIRARKYTRCGILLLILNAALSSAIAQMIFDDRAFEYKDWLIYAFAAYAFYKVIMSVINIVRARRQNDLTIQAIRELNLVDAAVSILALQTALLHTFSDGSVDISLFNTLTGCFVSAFALTLSIYMIIKGRKTVKELRIKDA